MQILWQDLRFAIRMLKKNPGFTIVAVLTLAVAIGANAVVFSAMNGLILRALNVPQAQTLYTLEHGTDKDSSESYPDYLDLRDRNRSFEGDRKSTRLNSSHGYISYAVFCLKKKKLASIGSQFRGRFYPSAACRLSLHTQVACNYIRISLHNRCMLIY